MKSDALERALYATKSIPNGKRVELWGNHDVWYTGDEQTYIAHVLPNYKYNNPYFYTGLPHTVRHPDNSNFMVVYDDYYKIKYLVIANYDFVEDYLDYHVSVDHWKWIIEQLSVNDGYDVIIVSHCPLQLYNSGSYDPITGDSYSTPGIAFVIRGYDNIVNIWNDRKYKRSGSITVDGTVIPYDFTGCTDDLLLSMAGHVHTDVVDYVGGNGLLEIAYDYFLNDTVHFALIDRENRKIKVWKLSNDSDTPNVDAWEAPFDKT